MTRKTWRKGNLSINYSNPFIVPYSDESDKEKVGTMKDVMYFYYDICIAHGTEELFFARTHDFPKVQELPKYIDKIVNFDMENSYLLEESQAGKTYSKTQYAQVVLDDYLVFDFEYFYKIERYDYLLSTEEESKTNIEKETEYVLTIGQMEQCEESFGKTIMIANISLEELLELKEVAESFCNEAIDSHNRDLKEGKTK